jgi:ABC-2 type transport system permease protein
MRWLFVKDLQILRRSPLLVTLLVLYPVVIAVLIGFALSRGPDKPRVAILNQVPRSSAVIDLGGERIDTSKYAEQLYDAIDPVTVSSRKEALDKVRSGDVLAALVLPPDFTQKLQGGLEPAGVEVFYNAEDPVKARYVRDTIKSQVQDASSALTRKFTEVALGYLRLIVTGGEFSFLGRHLNVLGLENSAKILGAVRAGLPRGSPARLQLDQVIRFTELARQNLDLSDEVLSAVGQPIKVKQTVLDGSKTPLSSFAVAIAATVSLMFVTVLLAAGMLALEREENAFSRLVRGLVSRTALLVEKGLLSAACALVVVVAMLCGLALFVDLDWGRFPLWVAASAAGALGFAAMGLAIGALTREVRAASLLAFMLALPIAFLALVPSGAVGGALYDAVRAVSAIFPFKPTLDAMNAALNDAGSIGPPIAHLAALAGAFGLLGRIGLKRFA